MKSESIEIHIDDAMLVHLLTPVNGPVQKLRICPFIFPGSTEVQNGDVKICQYLLNVGSFCPSSHHCRASPPALCMGFGLG